MKELGESGYDVVGLDWTINPAEARKLVGPNVTLQVIFLFLNAVQEFIGLLQIFPHFFLFVVSQEGQLYLGKIYLIFWNLFCNFFSNNYWISFCWYKFLCFADFNLKSREGALIANNMLLVVATAIVLLGTFYPLC